MLEFTYTGIDRSKYCVTNRIRLWWDGDVLKYDRRYVSKDGTVSETPIEHTFTGNEITTDNVAKMIHWGCCGWAAGGHELHHLKERIKATVELTPA
jgi:hypothetical protein|tara:strand:- start:213 stop:500 length:288 start_codon:yes stop_codon:yes gene_type:complete